MVTVCSRNHNLLTSDLCARAQQFLIVFFYYYFFINQIILVFAYQAVEKDPNGEHTRNIFGNYFMYCNKNSCGNIGLVLLLF